jgi:hypothetical protein
MRPTGTWHRTPMSGSGDCSMNIAYRDAWLPLDRAALPALIDFFERQAAHFRHEAAHIQVRLDPPFAPGVRPETP